MSQNLFAPEIHCSAVREPISPERELGAYEALWARDGISFGSIAKSFARHEGSIPSDFAAEADIRKYSRLALRAIRAAGISQFGVRVHGAREYPHRLRDAEHPVGLLYFQGTWDLVNTPCVSVVGTREATEGGKRRAAKLARLLVADGFTVMSGLARGIDTAAHRAAIAAGGSTIAVLGTPITSYYPRENRGLQRQIAARHLVISQVPIVRHSNQHCRDNSRFFLQRNATMSALSEGTVIVEAGEASGALVQARQALKQGRKLFVLDSCFRGPAQKWPARLLDQGAIRVSEFGTIGDCLAAADIKGTAVGASLVAACP